MSRLTILRPPRLSAYSPPPITRATADIDTPVAPLDPKLKAILESQNEEPEGYIYCIACASVITSADQKIEMGGRHDHYLSNPHGFEFHVGCFANALGCDISGPPEPADSWFQGYQWQLATCANCQAHMGWFYTATHGDNYFYGLVLDHIEEA